ncbi:MAG: hypothetical protein D6780_04270, partial [Candidatus Dadabacteria bacterium]
GLLLQEPTIIALKKDGKELEVIAWGLEAKLMVGRHPKEVAVVRPINEEGIVKREEAQILIDLFFKEVIGKVPSLLKHNVGVVIPLFYTSVQKEILKEIIDPFAREIYFIPSPTAIALGNGVLKSEKDGGMVINVGASRIEIAVIKGGEIIAGVEIKGGSFKIDRAIAAYIKDHYGVLIGESMAEDIKLTLASVNGTYDNKSVSVWGKKLISGEAVRITLTGAEIKSLLTPFIVEIITAIKETLEKTPAVMVDYVLEKGVILSGAASQLPGLVEVIKEEIMLNTHLVSEPILCAVKGAAKGLEILRQGADTYFEAAGM